MPRFFEVTEENNSLNVEYYMSNKSNIVIFLVVIVGIVSAIKFNHQGGQGIQQDAYSTAILVQGISAFGGMKLEFQSAFEATGEMPSSNIQAGLQSPENYSDQSLYSASILPAGIIELIYKESSGVDRGIIRFIPTVVQGTIEWSCESPNYQQIYSLECKYTGI